MKGWQEFLFGPATHGTWQRTVIGALVGGIVTVVALPTVGLVMHSVKPLNPFSLRRDIDAGSVRMEHIEGRMDHIETQADSARKDIARVRRVAELEAIIRTGGERDRVRAFMQLRDLVRPKLLDEPQQP